MIPKDDLSKVVMADIQALVTEGTLERRTLDYKLTLPGTSDGERHKFLADICSFANAAGGDLIYGIEEKDGRPNAIRGLSDFIENDVRLRLEHMIRTGISPRVPGVQIHVPPDPPSEPVMIVRVPRSWMNPHMVSFNASSRFYSRGLSGNFQMDVEQIRAAFDGAGGLIERIRRWRDDRVARIYDGDTPVPVQREGTLVFHIVPIDSFGNESRFSIEQLHKRPLGPLGAGGYNTRINLDGLLSFVRPTQEHKYLTYTQMFRSGRIEFTWADFTGKNESGVYIPSESFEREAIQTLKVALDCLRRLGVAMPILVSMVVVHGKGARMAVPARNMGRHQYAIDRDVLVLPDVLIEDWDAQASQILRPTIDGLWNVCGFHGSIYYDSEGNWEPNR